MEAENPQARLETGVKCRCQSSGGGNAVDTAATYPAGFSERIPIFTYSRQALNIKSTLQYKTPLQAASAKRNLEKMVFQYHFRAKQFFWS